MQVTLARKVTVKVLEVIASMKIFSQRPDYQKILELGEEGRISKEEIVRLLVEAGYDEKISVIVAKRFFHYFVELGFIDEAGQITKVGEEVLKDGMVPHHELGKYLLWIVDDPLIGKQVIHLERSKKTRTAGIQVAETDALKLLFRELKGKKFIDLIDDGSNSSNSYFMIDDFSPYSRDDNIYFAEKNIYQTEIQLNWTTIMDDDESGEKIITSYVVLSGKIKIPSTNASKGQIVIKEVTIKEFPRPINISKDKLDSIMEFILSQKMKHLLGWNRRLMAIEINDLDLFSLSEKSLKNHIMTKSWKDGIWLESDRFNYGEFLELKISDAPLVPRDGKIARKWLFWLVREETRKRYITVRDFKSIKEDFLAKKGVSFFYDLIDRVKLQDIVVSLRKKGQLDQRTYWHLQASLDLNMIS